ncbi:strictosidine synthase-like protein 4 [Tanacetum coccineum]
MESTRSSSLNPPQYPTEATRSSSWCRDLLITLVCTVAIALLLVQYDNFDAAAYPSEELAKKPIFEVPRVNSHVLHGSEKVGEGQLLGPEDIVYDQKLGVIYTSCGDGWIKRVRMNDLGVEDWVNTGGRPLGLALGYSGELYVADAYKVSLYVHNRAILDHPIDTTFCASII